VQIRTLDVLHVFWVPLLPIGAWSRWYCATCGARPHSATTTRRGFKIAGALALLIGSIAGWFVPAGEEVDFFTLWTMRIGLPVALFFTIRSIVAHRDEPAFQERLARVGEFAGHECPLCSGILVTGADLACSRCGARHLPLRRRAV